jgi:hypothetical protein
MHSSAQRVNDLRLICRFISPGQGTHSLAFAFTHAVSVPNQLKSATVLDQPLITTCELRFLG